MLRIRWASCVVHAGFGSCSVGALFSQQLVLCVRLHAATPGFFVCKLKKLSNDIKKDKDEEDEEDEDAEAGGSGSGDEEGGQAAKAGGGKKAPSGPKPVVIPVSKPKVREHISK